MKQEDKELLLRDLCGRLPYNTKAQFEETIETIDAIWLDSDEDWQIDGVMTSSCLYAVKPYFFPMYSMTEKQEHEFKNTCNGYCEYYWTEETIDWINKKPF